MKFRTSNHNFPVETGRWSGVPRAERLCYLCNSPAIADEFHYLFKCEALTTERLLYIPPKFYRFPNISKMTNLLNSKEVSIIRNLSKYLKTVSAKLRK